MAPATGKGKGKAAAQQAAQQAQQAQALRHLAGLRATVGAAPVAGLQPAQPVAVHTAAPVAPAPVAHAYQPQGLAAGRPTPKALALLRLLAAAPNGTLHRGACAVRMQCAKGWAAFCGRYLAPGQGAHPGSTLAGQGWLAVGMGANGVQYTITPAGKALLGS